MNYEELERVANSLVSPGKGILAADESFRTIKKRFDAIHLTSTEENRRSYREMLFTTPGVGEFISGVILFDETIHQSDKNGIPFSQVLTKQGIIPGIKVDLGTKPLPQFPGETITEGLDGLLDRLIDYHGLGARFSKWRAVIHIGEGIPTDYCIEANAHALARYAALSQEADLVPIVEPEVLMEGDHDIQRCKQVTEAVLQQVFFALDQARIHLEGMLLKPNMVLPGTENQENASPGQVATETISCLRRAVPAAVPGIVFLSGGQSPEEATENLNAMNVLGLQPWQLSFSYGRALQGPALQAWNGEAANVSAAQEIFYQTAKDNSLARYGKYSPEIVTK